MGLDPFIGPNTVPGPILTNMTGWWKADAITGVADAASLASWLDSSGNSRTLTSSGVNEPTYYKTTSAKLINGLPAVWFTAANPSFMIFSGWPGNAQPYTHYVVLLATTPANAQTMLSSENGGTEQEALFLQTSTYKQYAGGTSLAGGTTGSVAHLVTGVFTGASSVLYVDGTQVATGSPGTNSEGSTALYLGSNQGSSNFDGALPETILYKVAHNSTQVGTNHSYLSAKWGTP